MKLELFTAAVQQQWKKTGYNYVKLINAENMLKAGDPFTLLEPYPNNDEAIESRNVVPVTAPEIEKIILERSGMYYCDTSKV